MYFTIGAITTKLLYFLFVAGFLHIFINMFISMIHKKEFEFPVYLKDLYLSISKAWCNGYNNIQPEDKESKLYFILIYIAFSAMYPIINILTFPVTFTIVVMYACIVIDKINKDVKKAEKVKPQILNEN